VSSDKVWFLCSSFLAIECVFHGALVSILSAFMVWLSFFLVVLDHWGKNNDIILDSKRLNHDKKKFKIKKTDVLNMNIDCPFLFSWQLMFHCASLLTTSIVQKNFSEHQCCCAENRCWLFFFSHNWCCGPLFLKIIDYLWFLHWKSIPCHNLLWTLFYLHNGLFGFLCMNWGRFCQCRW